MSEVEIKVSQDLVRPIIQAKIEAAIASELHSAEELIGAVVASALATKVDESGTVRRDSYRNEHDLLDALTRNAIQQEAQQAVESWIEAQRPQLQAALESELKKRSKGLAKAMVEGLGAALKSRWSFNVACTFSENSG